MSSELSEKPFIWPLIGQIRRSDVAVVSALLVVMVVLMLAHSVHYLFFHTMAELIAIVISFSIFTLAWVSHRYLGNGYLVILGGAYGAIGLVDVFHTLTFQGINLFPGVSTNYPTQFWLTARFLEAVALMLAPFAIHKKPIFEWVAGGFLAIALLACGAVMQQWFPATFVEGVGLTAFKIYAEYLIIFIMLVALVLLLRARSFFEPRIFFLLTTSLVLACLTEFSFTRYAKFYDFANELGHYFRYLSVSLAFVALVLSGVRQPLALIFHQMANKTRELDELNTRLVDSEIQLNEAQSVAKVGSWYLDIATGALSWSKQTYSMFGVPLGLPQSIESLYSHVYHEDLDALQQAWALALQGQPYDVIHRIVVNQKIVWVRERAYLKFATDGTPLSAIGTVQDITEARHVQDLLQQSKAFYTSVFDSIVESVAVLNDQGQIIAVNQPWRQFASDNGSPHMAADSVGQNYLDTCASAYVAIESEDAAVAHAVANGIRAVIRGEIQHFEIEYPCHSPDQQRWFSLHVSPLAGERAGAVVAHQNVTARTLAQQALRQSEQTYRLLVDMSADAIMLTAPDGRIFDANPAACRMFGRSQEEICNLGRSAVVDTSNPKLAVALDVRQRTGHFSGETVFKRKDGSSFLGEVSSALFLDKNGNPRTSMIIRDISERKRIETDLRESEARMSAVFQASPIGIVISRVEDGKVLEVNDACLRMYKYTRDEALGRTVGELSSYVHPEQRTELLKLLRQQHYVEGFLVDFRDHDGTQGVLEMSGRLIALRGETCLLSMLSDVTERVRANALIQEQAFHDALTQLPNRHLLTNRMQHAMLAAKRSGCFGALIFLDLDNFKPLNDTHGHEFGDLLLIEAADRLLGCVREIDTVARIGGDEFVIMLCELGVDRADALAQAQAVAEKVRSALSKPYFLTTQHQGTSSHTVKHYCTASIGVALFDAQSSHLDVLAFADKAMYEAKRGGRNIIYIHSDDQQGSN